jgi:hypothetical protein
VGVTKSFRTESITKYSLTTINTVSEATQRVIAAKLTRLTHKTDITAPGGRELQFSLQAASPETFGYTLVYRGGGGDVQNMNGLRDRMFRTAECSSNEVLASAWRDNEYLYMCV